MKAVILKGFGDIDNLEIADISIPVISENEVLIKVQAIGINPVDIKTRKGKSLAQSLIEFNPIILGWDVSGTVVEAGKDVSLFKKGDEVFGMINFPGHGKAYAEYVSAQESHLALKPAGISHEEAAGASLAALTAWQILRDKSGIKPGHHVLIHAAAGGVGHYAVQMAKHLGAIVTGTASGSNSDFVRSLGAAMNIDYEKEYFEDVLDKIDFVLDTIGGEYINRSLKVLKPGGTIVCIPSGAAEQLHQKAAEAGRTGLRFTVQSSGNDMREIAEMLEKGIIRTHISGKYSLDDIKSAHLQIESGKTKGKIVVIP